MGWGGTRTGESEAFGSSREAGAVHARTRVGGGEGSEIETQRLQRGLEGAELCGFALELIEKGVGLSDEVGVALDGR